MPKKPKLKQMIEDTLIAKGGIDYLIRQADENPKSFLTLLKSIIPKDVNVGKAPGPFQIDVDALDDDEE